MSKQAIDRVFTRPGLKLMNHVVAGYPTADISRKCIQTMEAAGSDMIEIQIPFSDPMADGLTIVKANHCALSQGMTLETFWPWLQQVRKETHLPLLLMTYYNIPFRMGLEKFFAKAQESGISGVIIPDISFDNRMENYPDRIRPFDLHPIQVISPSVGKKRLGDIASLGSGFVYTTLKVGITGSQKSQGQGLEFLKTVREYVGLPIAAGFGIESPDQVKALSEKADMAVIGSKIIRLLDEAINQDPDNPSSLTTALENVSHFIKACKEIPIR